MVSALPTRSMPACSVDLVRDHEDTSAQSFCYAGGNFGRLAGAIEQHAGTQNGTSIHRGYSYHEYVALEETSDGHFQEDRTVVLYHGEPTFVVSAIART